MSGVIATNIYISFGCLSAGGDFVATRSIPTGVLAEFIASAPLTSPSQTILYQSSYSSRNGLAKTGN